jgi:hypothetical protein
MSEPEQPEAYAELSRITNVAVREDGEEVRLTCQGNDGGEFDLLIPAEALHDLTVNLQMISMSTDIKRETFRPARVPHVNFGTPDPLFFVKHLGCVVRPEAGQISLQIEQVNGPDFQVAFSREHAKFLFEALLQVYEPEEKSN